MATWTRDVCGSKFEFTDWGVDVVSLVKPAKYAGLTDAEHWEQVATFECAELARLCQHIKDTYTVSAEPLGDAIPLSFGINGTLTYNEDLTMTLALPDYSDTIKSEIVSWIDTNLDGGVNIV